MGVNPRQLLAVPLEGVSAWVDQSGNVYGPRGLRKLKQGRYLQVGLYVDGRIRSFLVHRLVATAFLGPRPAGQVTNHRNGNKHDNRPENLEYCTPSENNHHAVRHGLVKTARGERVHGAKLTDSAVREILSSRQPAVALAGRFGVHPSTIYAVRAGDRWRHVESEASHGD